MKWIKDVFYWLSIYLVVVALGAIISGFFRGFFNVLFKELGL